MSLLKYIERLQRIDSLIRRRATGSADEFAEKMGVSRSQLMQDLKELRELGAPIQFVSSASSYCYTAECRLILEFNPEYRMIRGGIAYLDSCEASSIIHPHAHGQIVELIKDALKE
jgi:hypothetical protein